MRVLLGLDLEAEKLLSPSLPLSLFALRRARARALAKTRQRKLSHSPELPLCTVGKKETREKEIKHVFPFRPRRIRVSLGYDRDVILASWSLARSFAAKASRCASEVGVHGCQSTFSDITSTRNIRGQPSGRKFEWGVELGVGAEAERERGARATSARPTKRRGGAEAAADEHSDSLRTPSCPEMERMPRPRERPRGPCHVRRRESLVFLRERARLLRQRRKGAGEDCRALFEVSRVDEIPAGISAIFLLLLLFSRPGPRISSSSFAVPK